MKGKRYSEEQIVKILSKHTAGATAREGPINAGFQI